MMPTIRKKRELLESTTKKGSKTDEAFVFVRIMEKKVNKEVTNFYLNQFFEIVKIRRGTINC